MIIPCSYIYALIFSNRKNYGYLLFIGTLITIDGNGITFIDNNPNRKLQVEDNKDAVFNWQFNVSSGEIIEQITFGFINKDNLEVIIAGKTQKKDVIFNNQIPQRYGILNVKISTDDSSYATLTLKAVQLNSDDGIKFYCEVRTLSKYIQRSSIILEVITLPSITSKPTSIISVKEKDKFSLECGAEAKPIPYLKWVKNGINSTLIEAFQSIKFEVSSAQQSHTGRYICIATNVAGSINYTTDVIVMYKPVIDLTRSTSRVGSYIANPQPTRLSCVANGVPEPTYRWNDPLGYEVDVQSTYAFQMPTVNQFGTYICEARNYVDSVIHRVTVFEISKPGIVQTSIKSVTARSVQINFVIPTNLGNGTLKKLSVSYASNKSPTKEAVLNSSLSTCEISDLNPYTDYIVNITVQNEFFTSEGQMQRFKTSAAAPGPPANISATVISSTQILVQWNPPIDPNGIITNYSVKFFEQNSVSFENAQLFPLELNLKKSFEVLKPNTPYVIYVRASNTAGDGEWSKMVLKFTEPIAPGAPNNVRINIVDYQTINISWSPPLLTAGESTMYELKLTYTSKETQEKGEISVSLIPDQQHTRTHQMTILPYTDNYISVREAAGDALKWGNFSAPVNFSLPEGVPDPPTNLRVLETTQTQSAITWLRPYKINGILHNFTVNYQNDSGIYSETVALSIFNINNQSFYHTIQNLKVDSEYTVSVTTYSAGFYSRPSNKINLRTNSLKGTTEQNSAQQSSNKGPILGAIFAMVALIILAVIVYLLIIRKKKLKRSSSGSSQSGFLKLPNVEPVKVFDLDLMKHSNSVNSFIPSEYAQSLQRSFTPLRPILVSALKDYVAKYHSNKDKGFIDEFRSIKPEGDFTFEISMRPENKCKNRYANILAYDHSRVVLNTVENLDGSDYVNANYIDGYTRKAKFIATQGPVSAAFNDFWRMVWEQNTETIVMITNLVERNRIKCQKYWPTLAEKFEKYGNINVEIIDEMELADYIIRRFKVYNVKSDCQMARLITHYQFLSWPDHGVPQFATPLLQFIKRVRSVSDQNSGPIVLHCSAGVGRTGTYIAIDSMLDQIELEKAVDIFGCVTHIRSQRSLMVQTEAQYIFIYNALLEAVSCGNTEVAADELQARIKHLDNLNPSSARTYLQEEFERLDLNLEVIDSHESAVLPVNLEKNRFRDVLPYESTRVKLWPFPNVEGSDYINASFIDGYQQREAYILTQAPLENSIHDFWRMVWEYEVFSLVMLSSPKERDMHHCYPYWPIKNEPAIFGLLRVQIAAEEEKAGFVKREFIVTNSKNGESRTVSHLMYFDWPEDGTPNIANVLEMIGQLQNIQQKTGNSSIVIHCNDGSGRSGTLAALMYCLERIKHEAMVDVFQTIRSMRTQRKALVNTLAHYQFIYLAIRSFLDCFSAYSNFK